MYTEFGDIKGYLEKGALVLDVRTHQEYNEGHVEGSIHVVLDVLDTALEQLKELNKPLITCCKSGVRSEHAKDYLLANGIDCINGGPWQNVDQYI